MLIQKFDENWVLLKLPPLWYLKQWSRKSSYWLPRCIRCTAWEVANKPPIKTLTIKKISLISCLKKIFASVGVASDQVNDNGMEISCN